VAFCTRCGATLAGTRFCRACGAEGRSPLPPPQEQQTIDSRVRPADAAAPGLAVTRSRRRVWFSALAAVLLLLVVAVSVWIAGLGDGPSNLRPAAGSDARTPEVPSAPGGSPATTDATSAPAVPQGSTAQVLAQDGNPNLVTYGGPSTTVFDPRGAAHAGQALTVLCSTYGQSVRANGGASQLWDFTSLGWLSNQVVQTGAVGAVIPACQGNAENPSVGQEAPDRSLGPFPVIADQDVSVRDQPTMSAGGVLSLVSGDFVHLVCAQATGVTVPAPTRLASAGSNDQWDRIDAPANGWVPDSFVASSTNGAAAPKCVGLAAPASRCSPKPDHSDPEFVVSCVAQAWRAGSRQRASDYAPDAAVTTLFHALDGGKQHPGDYRLIGCHATGSGGLGIGPNVNCVLQLTGNPSSFSVRNINLGVESGASAGSLVVEVHTDSGD